MVKHLQIAAPVERWLVGLADLALAPLAWPSRWSNAADGPVERILLFRLERVGDLVMAEPGMAAVRLGFPGARVELVVGSWNRALAGFLPGIDEIHVLDAPWLARGLPSARLSAIAPVVRALRRRRFDLAINFEGDIRSHALMWATGARRRIGFDMAGGGPLLTDRVPFDPRLHVTEHGLALARHACPDLPRSVDRAPRLEVPAALCAEASDRLRAVAQTASGHPRMLIGIHPSAGRLVKQWPPDAFGRAAGDLAMRHGAAVVLTGSADDRDTVAAVQAALPPEVRVLNLAGQLDLVQLAAVLQQLRLVLSVDTGPMHLASAVGTPVVGVFGPSDPRRWGPGAFSTAVRIDLPCSPCNRIRRPPARCVGHVPDCLTGITPEQVVAAAEDLLARTSGKGHGHGAD